MSGTVPFIALRPCGCVFSEAAVRAVIPSLTRGFTSSKHTDEVPDAAAPIVPSKSKEAVACPNCGKNINPTETETVSPINPPREVQEDLLDALLTSRAAAKAGKKRKAGAITPCGAGKDAVGGVDSNGASKAAEEPSGPGEASSTVHRVKAARTAQTPAPVTNTLDPAGGGRQSVAQKLAAQEQKRLVAQAGMSDAVKSMFKAKDQEKSGGGAADFFGRTFTRVSLSLTPEHRHRY
jgi:hypothetical protein